MKKSNWLAASTAAILLFACSTDKEPAQQAVARIDSTLSDVHDAAAKYSPETLKTVQAQVDTLKGHLYGGNYKAVLAGAPAVSAAVASLKQDAETKQSAAEAARAHTKQQWRTLNSEVPKLIAGIHTQVDTLSSTKRLPKGLTKAKLESAKAGAASLDTMWTDATNADTSGDYEGAVVKGQAVKDKATELMNSLGMKSS